MCTHGHDLTQPGAVRVTQRKRHGKDGSAVYYPERQCVECIRRRSRERWRKNRSAAT